jgi:hypothetical protein
VLQTRKFVVESTIFSALSSAVKNLSLILSVEDEATC